MSSLKTTFQHIAQAVRRALPLIRQPAEAESATFALALVDQQGKHHLPSSAHSRFQAAIGTGATTVSVTFPEALPEAPTAINAVVLKANSGDSNVGVLAVSAVTKTGFVATLTGAAPAGAKLMVSTD